MTTTLSVRIDTRTKTRLEALAKRARRSKSFLAAEAIATFVEAECWQLDETLEGRAALITGARQGNTCVNFDRETNGQEPCCGSEPCERRVASVSRETTLQAPRS